MLWIRNEKTLWKASFRRREITDVIPLLFFATRCNFAFRKCTNHQNHALGSLYAPKCTIFRCNLPPKKMHFRQCRGFICNKCPTYLSPKSSHISCQIGILHYSIKVFVGYWDMLPYYPSHRKHIRPDDASHPVFSFTRGLCARKGPPGRDRGCRSAATKSR